MATFRPLVTGPDTTPPTVAMTAPTGGSVFGTIAVTANAQDNIGVAGVQLRVDGANLGTEITTAPFTLNLDTTVLSDGPHTFSAIARDSAGNTSTATGVTITVSNGTNPAAVGQWGASFESASWP